MPPTHRRRQHLLAAATLLAATPAFANTSAWLTPASGTWSDPTRWFPAVVPNNGSPTPSATYDVTLGQSSTPYSVTLNSAVTVTSLTFAPNLSFNFAGGTLSLATVNATLTPTIKFTPPITLSGTGTISFDGARPGVLLPSLANASLTLSPGITLRTGTQSATLDHIVNNGTISAQTPGQSLTLTSFSNPTGLLAASNGGTLTLSGSLTPATLGNFSTSTGGTVQLSASSTADFTYSVLNLTDTSLALSPDHSLTLAQRGTLKGGSVTSSTGTPLLIGPSGPPNTEPFIVPYLGPATLSGTTVSVDISFSPGANLYLDSGTLFDANRVTLAGSLYPNYLSRLVLTGTQQLQATAAGAQILFAGTNADNAILSTGTSLLIGPNVTIRTDTQSGTVGTPTVPFVNQGLISAQTPGTSITLTGSSALNVGTLAASNGASLILAGSNWTNTGTISVAADASLTVAATTTGTFLASLNTAAAGSLTLATGASINNASNDLHLAPNLGNLSLVGSPSVVNGTITGSLDAKILVPTQPANTTLFPTLNGVTLAADVALAPNAKLLLAGAITFANNAHISLPGATLSFATGGTPSLSGPGEITFDGPLPSTLSTTGSPLTLGPGTTIRTNGGSGSVTLAANNGTLSAESPAQTLIANLSAPGTGTLRATNNSTLRLTGSFPTAALGTLSNSTNGSIQLAANLDNAAATLSLSASSNLTLTGGKITGGSLTTPDDTPLIVLSGTLASVDLDIPISATGTLTASDVIIRRPLNSSSNLTLSGAWSNLGSISLSTGTLTLNSLPANPGPVTVASGAVNFNLNLTTAQLSTITRLNSTARITAATLDNSGTTLTLSNAQGPLELSTNSTLTGGIVVTTTPTQFLLPNSSAVTLNALTLRGPVALPSGSLPLITNGITLDAGASLSIASTSATTGPRLSGSSPIAGSGEIVFDGTSSNNLINTANNSPTTAVIIGPGVTVRTGAQGGTLGSNSSPNYVTVNGTISAQTPAKTITFPGGSVINGTIRATNGGTVSFPLGTYNGLSTGTWFVGDASTISLPGYYPTNDTTVTLSGPTSKFDVLNSLITNAASLTLTAGRKFITAGSLTNTGSITLGPAATLKIRGSFTNTGSLDLAGGSLILDYTSPSPAALVRQQLVSHFLTSSTATTDPDHPLAIAYLEAKDLLSLTGSQTSTWSGLPVDATALLLFLTTPGDANGDGKLTPDDYSLLDRGFAKHLTTWQNGDFNYDGTINSADYLLLDTTYSKAQGFSPAFLAQRESQFGPAYVSTLLASLPDPALPLFSILYPLSSFFRRPRRQFLRKT